MHRNRLVMGATAAVAVRAVLGLALFASLGWVWGAVLLGPRLGELEGIVVATAVALALPILGGLALQAARLPLHARAWGGLVAGLTLAGDAFLLLRSRARGSQGPDSRGPDSRGLNSRGLDSRGLNSRGPRGEDADAGPRPARWSPSAWQATVFGAALLVAAGAVGVARVGASIQRYPGFTELWLTAARQAPAAADLGVINHQGGSRRYRLVLLHQGHTERTWNLVLADGATWRRTITLSASSVTSARLYLLPDLRRPYRQVATGPAQAQPRAKAHAPSSSRGKPKSSTKAARS
jgi:hypothetical protein